VRERGTFCTLFDNHIESFAVMCVFECEVLPCGR
jgi:hypothetical protein